ncbi:MAG: glycosyltransferase [Candidatus Gastranaerophilales bacterium]|nr:glycosyltransferase [Candidatus Gastranaerophilales bacterium]MCM1072990.1 glycosyltransferase [Bacteroides sp.]
MNNIKISVIVPVYNVEKYLGKCLDSLVNQSIKDVEIICINDGSTDKSGEILNLYAQKYSQIVVLNQSNKGQSAARNLGISMAHGEYLGFVDSDDWVDLEYFEKLYAAAKKYDCDIACAGFKRCGKFKKSLKKSFKKERVYTNIDDKAFVDNLPDHNYIWNKIYKRDKWNFTFVEGRYYEDIALLIKVLYHMDNMVTVPKTYYNYRRNIGSTVTQKTPKHKQDLLWAKNECRLFVEGHGIKLKKTTSFHKKERIKLFGVTILKIYSYEDFVQYRLFGFIPFITRTIA